MIPGIVIAPFAVNNRAYQVGERVTLSPEAWIANAGRLRTIAEHEAFVREERERQEAAEAASAPERARAAKLAAIAAERDAKLAQIDRDLATERAERERQRLASMVEVDVITAVLVHERDTGPRRIEAGTRDHVTHATFKQLAQRGIVRAVTGHDAHMRTFATADRDCARAELTERAKKGDDRARRALEALEESEPC